MIKVKKDIEDYLENDEISRICSGKKDFVRPKGQIKQKRILCDTIKNTKISDDSSTSKKCSNILQVLSLLGNLVEHKRQRDMQMCDTCQYN